MGGFSYRARCNQHADAVGAMLSERLSAWWYLLNNHLLRADRLRLGPFWAAGCSKGWCSEPGMKIAVGILHGAFQINH